MNKAHFLNLVEISLFYHFKFNNFDGFFAHEQEWLFDHNKSIHTKTYCSFKDGQKVTQKMLILLKDFEFYFSQSLEAINPWLLRFKWVWVFNRLRQA